MKIGLYIDHMTHHCYSNNKIDFIISHCNVNTLTTPHIGSDMLMLSTLYATLP